GTREMVLRTAAHLEGGKLYLVRGDSGVGKSTLARVLLGLTPFHEPPVQVQGEIALNSPTGAKKVLSGSQYHTESRSEFVLIPQLGQQGFIDELSVPENVALFANQNAKDAQAKIETLAARVRLWPLPKEMARASGGEKMRLATIRAFLATETRGACVLIADEPTAGLDERSAEEVVKALRAFAKNPANIVIVITHDSESITDILPDEDDKIPHNEIHIEAWSLEGALPEKLGVVGRFTQMLSETKDGPAERFKASAQGLAEGIGGIVLSPLAFVLGITSYPKRMAKHQLMQVARATLSPSTIGFVTVACAFVAVTLGIFVFHLLPQRELLEPLILEDLLRAFGVMLTVVILPVIAALFATAKNTAAQTSRLAASVRSGLLDSLAMAKIRPESWALVPAAISQMASIALATTIALLVGEFAGAMTYVVRGDVMGIRQIIEIMHFGIAAEEGWLGWLALRMIGSGFIAASIAAWFGVQPAKSEAEVSQRVQQALVWSLFAVLIFQCALIIAQFT
ncbi:MAG: ABC transporter permease, partial [Planctomycetes bacterium]|nr:ABC transporter permease [Planctomycetota bacterium]